MIATLDERTLLRLRMDGQRLLPGERRSSGDVLDVVRAMCGIQAQLPAAAALGVRARHASLRNEDITRAREQDRSIVRTWGMRGTLHLFAIEDVPWLLSILGPVFIARGRRRRMQLGMDDKTTEAGLRALRHALADNGPMTRAEIVEQVRRRGVEVAPDGQAGYHLIHYAGLAGAICLGPDRGDEQTFVLASDWGIPTYSGTRENALETLARRYLTTYGPAQLDDFTAWSGLPKRDGRDAWSMISDDLIEVRAAGAVFWMLRSHAFSMPETSSEPVVRLLPQFDGYLLGYRDRSLIIDPEYAGRIQRGGGWLHPVVIADGRVVGTWTYATGTKEDTVTVQLFEDPLDTIEPALASETEEIGRFLDSEPRLAIENPQQ